MRVYFFLLLFVCQAGLAQDNQLPEVQQKMQALKWLAGKWQGPVYLTGAAGTKREFIQAENCEAKLKKSIPVLNEIAFLGRDTIFQNMVVLGYDAAKSKYILSLHQRRRSVGGRCRSIG